MKSKVINLLIPALFLAINIDGLIRYEYSLLYVILTVVCVVWLVIEIILMFRGR